VSMQDQNTEAEKTTRLKEWYQRWSDRAAMSPRFRIGLAVVTVLAIVLIGVGAILAAWGMRPQAGAVPEEEAAPPTQAPAPTEPAVRVSPPAAGSSSSHAAEEANAVQSSLISSPKSQDPALTAAMFIRSYYTNDTVQHSYDEWNEAQRTFKALLLGADETTSPTSPSGETPQSGGDAAWEALRSREYRSTAKISDMWMDEELANSPLGAPFEVTTDSSHLVRASVRIETSDSVKGTGQSGATGKVVEVAVVCPGTEDFTGEACMVTEFHDSPEDFYTSDDEWSYTDEQLREDSR
jgi:hypothetical protein